MKTKVPTHTNCKINRNSKKGQKTKNENVKGLGLDNLEKRWRSQMQKSVDTTECL